MPVDLLLKETEVIRGRENRVRERVPKDRGRMKETVTVTVNPRIAYLHRVPVSMSCSSCITRSRKGRGNATRELTRTVTKIVSIEQRERSHLTAKGK